MSDAELTYYFDYAAATPMAPSVLAVMQPYVSELFYNPSATYRPAQSVANDLAAARVRVAHWLGARPAEVIFTAGGTEANNLAISGVMRHFTNWPDETAGPVNVVTSAIEHEAVLQPAGQFDRRVVPVTGQGLVTPAAVEALIDDRTVLVSIMYANNEVGTIQPLTQIAQLVKGVRQRRLQQGNKLPLYLHTDACQAANYLDLHTARLGVDLMTINGGKIYGAKQSGALYVRAGVELKPLILGGGQEAGWRSGTENVAACVGLAAALDLAQAGRHQEINRLQLLQQLFYRLLAEQLPTAIINGSRHKRLPNNIHLTIPGSDNERLLVLLEAKGILAAAGSACSASSQEPSHVLRAMGLSDEQAQASLRFTMGRGTDEPAVRHAITALTECSR